MKVPSLFLKKIIGSLIDTYVRSEFSKKSQQSLIINTYVRYGNNKCTYLFDGPTDGSTFTFFWHAFYFEN